ncbi:MAG: DUF2807 domain-containing protein [Bacteroidetes bacterium]|nr:DUF2807 domain-containing protein [Bacteroidota bacterium]
MKTTTKLFLGVFIFTVLVSFNSCKKENMCDCIKRTGKIIQEKRTLGEFTKVEAEDNLNVYITQDSVQEVMIEAGENLVPLIETELQGGTLFIRNKNRCNWTRSYDKPLNVYLTMPKIEYITNSGTATLRSLNTITQATFDIETKNSGDIELTVNNTNIISHIFGSGDVILKGTTNQHYCDIGGTAYLYCKDLNSTYTYIHTFTIGPSEVKATGTLDCKIDGKGNVLCYGNPSLVQQSGKGPGVLYIK